MMIRYILALMGLSVVGSYGALMMTPTPTISQQFSPKSGVPVGIYQYFKTYNSDSVYNTGSNGRYTRTSWGRTYYSQGGGGGGGK